MDGINDDDVSIYTFPKQNTNVEIKTYVPKFEIITIKTPSRNISLIILAL